jgi:NADPH-dependent ferric siderophore reductase
MTTERPPTRPRPVPMAVSVLSVEQLSASMVRVNFSGDDLARFQTSAFTDCYVKLMFPRPGVQYPEPLNIAEVQASYPQDQWPVVRTYTVRAFDPEALVMTIDFVVHGDQGIAGPWAAAARPGDRLHLSGPGGGYAPDPQASWHLLVGDESALPAIAAAIDALPADASGHVLIEVPGPESEITLAVPAGVAITWVHAGHSTPGSRLVEWVAAVQIPTAGTQAFVHGEAGFVAQLRQLLRVDRALPKESLSISGYWRLGVNDEGWRAAKASWNAAAEEIERRAGVA